MASLKDLQIQQHKRLLSARVFYRIVASESFIEAYSNATNESRMVAVELIRRQDRKGLLVWIKQQENRDYGAMSLRELRDHAKRLRISYFSRMDKAQLLSEIVRHERSAELDSKNHETA